MSNWTARAREALWEATRLRRRIGLGRTDPVCIYDALEEKLDIEVRFQASPSLEGMYIKGPPPTILVCSERPPGRQAYTCAHELGHHVFGHGLKVDECLAPGAKPAFSSREEWLADRFANSFLMPKYAVERAFVVRGWHWGTCKPLAFYVVAGQLGVGYETLIQNMRWSLGMLAQDRAKDLLRVSPKELRTTVLNGDLASHLLIVDRSWNNKVAADLQIGDWAILPHGTSLEQRVVRVVGDHEMGVLVEARRPGTERALLSHEEWVINIRVSRRQYVGRSLFRHLEDPDYE